MFNFYLPHSRFWLPKHWLLNLCFMACETVPNQTFLAYRNIVAEADFLVTETGGDHQLVLKTSDELERIERVITVLVCCMCSLTHAFWPLMSSNLLPIVASAFSCGSFIQTSGFLCLLAFSCMTSLRVGPAAAQQMQLCQICKANCIK